MPMASMVASASADRASGATAKRTSSPQAASANWPLARAPKTFAQARTSSPIATTHAVATRAQSPVCSTRSGPAARTTMGAIAPEMDASTLPASVSPRLIARWRPIHQKPQEYAPSRPVTSRVRAVPCDSATK